MARRSTAAESSSAPPSGWLATLTRGDLLAQLDRTNAEYAYRLYSEGGIEQLSWTGAAIEATVGERTISIGDGPVPPSELGRLASEAGLRPSAAPLIGAILLQWVDVRAELLRRGPGTLWRRNARQPFLTIENGPDQQIDLSHMDRTALLSAMSFQISLQQRGRARAEIVADQIRIHVTLPSGQGRQLLIPIAMLPGLLPAMQAHPKLELIGELGRMELSEARLRPALVASWDDSGIHLDPGYVLPDGGFLALEKVNPISFGRWILVGRFLCRRLDAETMLVPFFQKGQTTLVGRDALRFLTMDHPTLLQESWYLPQGELRKFERPITPTLQSVHVARGRGEGLKVVPTFQAPQGELSWDEVTKLRRFGFLRKWGQIVRAPDLGQLEEAGFRLPKQQVGRGLSGDRLALLRLAAESSVGVTSNDPEIQHILGVLRDTKAAQLPTPAGYTSVLRPYQRAGLEWLWQRSRIRVGALLADDMGLGKTHQVMAFLCRLLEHETSPRVLVVCPRGVLEHWQSLVETYAPVLNVRVYHGAGRTLESLPDAGTLVLTTYHTLARSAKDLLPRNWDVAVFDEAQKVKNPRTKGSRAARQVEAVFRIALTGTPVENHLLELWSVVDLIVPGYLGGEKQFRAEHRDPTPTQLDRLRRRIGLITLRRVKEQVLTDLPAKIEDVRTCRLSSEQRRLYRDVRLQRAPELLQQLRDSSQDIPYMHIFALLTRLKQICDHPALVTPTARRGSSGKLEVFDELVDQALASEQQVVVFSQYVEMLKILDVHLTQREIPHLVMTGSTGNRGRLVKRFNSEQHERVLLASLLASGVGIDLTAASVVIHYDRWWNPAVENQATDRVHRIGQRRFVQVFKLTTRGTIEERIDQILRRKLQLMEDVIAPTEEVLRSLSRDDLTALLEAPLPDEPGASD
jgi:superfamily II DNA or RNA helicase